MYQSYKVLWWIFCVLTALFFFFCQDDHESGSSSTSRSVSDSSKAVAKSRRLQQVAPSDPDLPPGEWWPWGQWGSSASLLRIRPPGQECLSGGGWGHRVSLRLGLTYITRKSFFFFFNFNLLTVSYRQNNGIWIRAPKSKACSGHGHGHQM